MKTTAIFFSLLLAACATASAKPPIVVPKPVPKALPEYVDPDDAETALKAQADVQATANAANIALLRWQRARAKLIEKYGIDPEQAHGWDIDAVGKLKARREAPKQPTPTPAPTPPSAKK